MREVRKSFWDSIVVVGNIVLVVPLMLASEYIQTKTLGVEGYGKVNIVYSAVVLLFLFSANWIIRTTIRLGKEEFLKENSLRKTIGSYMLLSFSVLLMLVTVIMLFQDRFLAFFDIKRTASLYAIFGGALIMILRAFVTTSLGIIRLVKIQATLERFVLKLFLLVTILLAFVFYSSIITVEFVIGVLIVGELSALLVGLFFLKRSLFLPIVISKKALKLMLILSIPFMFETFSSFIVTYVDTYVIKYYLGLESVGIYTAAYKTTTALRSFIHSIVYVLLPIAIALKVSGKYDQIKNYLTRVIPQIMAVGFIGIGTLLIYSKHIFLIIYGDNFAESLLSFNILLSSLLFVVFSSLSIVLVIAYDKVKENAILSLILAGFNFIADIFFVQWWGIEGAAIASFIVFSAPAIYWWQFFKKEFNHNRNLPYLFLVGIVIISGVMMYGEITFWVRAILSFMTILTILIIARYNGLVRAEDASMLQEVDMPQKVRELLEKIISRVSRSTEQ